MSRSPRTPRPSLALLAAGLVAGSLAAQSTKLNGPMAPAPDATSPRILDSRLSPDGELVVYRGDHERTGTVGLHVVPADGSAPALQLAAGPVFGFEVSPAGTHVAYRLGTNYWETDLHLVGIHGQGARFLSAYATLFQFTPDGERLVYSSSTGFWSVLVAGGAPLRLGDAAQNVFFTADSTRAISSVRRTVPGGWGDFFHELWDVPLDGTAPTRLNPGQELEVTQYLISPDGSRVVYIAGPSLSPGSRLYSVCLDAPPAPVGLSLDGSDEEVFDAAVSADSSVVVYRRYSGNQVRLYRVAIDGGTPVELSGPMVSAGVSGAPAFLVTPQGLVVYRADPEFDGVFHLYAVPLSGGTPERIERPGPRRFEITSDGMRVVFEVESAPSAPRELYTAELEGSFDVVRLSTPMVPKGGLIRYSVTPGLEDIVYTARQESRSAQLYRVPADGSALPVRLNGPLPEGGEVDGLYPLFNVDPVHRRVVYRADQETDELHELFAVSLDGAPPCRLNPPLPPSPIIGSVRAYAIEPDGEHVLFTGDGGRHLVDELYRVSIAGGAVERVNAPLQPDVEVLYDATRISADGRWALYSTDDRASPANPRYDLYSVELTSGATPHLHTAGLPGIWMQALELASGSERFAFLTGTPTNSREVFAARFDGAGGRVQLSSGIGSGFEQLQLTPDGLRAAFSGYASPNFTRELFTAPLDGSVPQVRISQPPQINRNVTDFRVAGGRGWTAFLADSDVDERYQLYAAPSDGSTLPHALVTRLVGGGDVVELEVTPDGRRVVYLADQEVDGRNELYSTPILRTPHAGLSDGTERVGRVKLSGVFLPGNQGVFGFLLTPAGDQVLYLAQQGSAPTLGIYCVPVDRGAPPRRIAAASPDRWLVSSDGLHVVYTHTISSGVTQLYSVPLDGHRSPRRLNAQLPAGGDVVAFAYRSEPTFQITPDGRTVVYVADQTLDERYELFAVDIEGTLPPVLLNGPLVEGGDVGQGAFHPFRIVPDGSAVVYLADQDVDGRLELYTSPLP